MIHYDLIVIGMGLSGLMAAKTAVEAGAKTLIVAKGTGSLCLFSNTIDVLGVLPAGFNLPEGVEHWARENPCHPYSKLGWIKIEEALLSFASIFDSSYPFQSNHHENDLIPTGAGTYRPTYLVPPTMVGASSLKREKGLVVGLKGFKDFCAAYVADQLNCRGITVSLPKFSGQQMTAVAIARQMEMESYRETIGWEVKKEWRGESLVGLPALLGVRDPLGAKRHLEALVGAQIFEIPILPPSIPGMRIFRRFRGWLIERGVTVLLGHSVCRVRSNGKRCLAIEISHPPLVQSYSADRLILATGRFIGGGLRADEKRIFEPILDLPVTQPKSREDWFGHSFFEPHPLHQAGVLTDSSFRPLDEKGEPLLENLWVAGSILAGHNCIEEKSREGIEIATGYWAAKHALAALG